MRTYVKSELKELEGKEFANEEECRKAEAEVNAEIAKKQELATTRKNDAENVKKAIVAEVEARKAARATKVEAFKKYLAACEEADKKLEDAEKAKDKALDEFCKKHPEGFHETIKIGDNYEARFDYDTEESVPSLGSIFSGLFW